MVYSKAVLWHHQSSYCVLACLQVDYLVTPRVAACMIAGPALNVLCFTMGALRPFLVLIAAKNALEAALCSFERSPGQLCDADLSCATTTDDVQRAKVQNSENADST